MWRSWQDAMQHALYGPGGFYTRGECPAAHFRTSVHASSRYADAVLALLRAVDAALGRPARLDLVDVGAGRGELLAGVLSAASGDPASGDPASGDPAFAGRISACAVEVAPRPAALDPRIRWCSQLPPEITGLVIASEWLDNVPLDVAEHGRRGLRLVLVEEATGAERPGPALPAADLAWLERWWPLASPGDRAEVGEPRDRAWAAVIRRLRRGVAVAMDYSHRRGERPRAGTLAGYRDGRPVPPVPDGSCDLTAHVALDACAAAGEAAGACASALTTQRQALMALGLCGRRPPLSLAEPEAQRYLQAFQQACEDAELTDLAGLGGFGWLIQTAGLPLPGPLAALGNG